MDTEAAGECMSSKNRKIEAAFDFSGEVINMFRIIGIIVVALVLFSLISRIL